MSQESSQLSEKLQPNAPPAGTTTVHTIPASASPRPADSLKVHRLVNEWAARFTPFMLVGAVGYATWVVVALLAVNTYIHPPQGLDQQTGAGAAILVIYWVVFIPMATSYGRLIWTMLFNPGYVPLEPANSHIDPYLDRAAVYNGVQPTPAGIDKFIARGLFESDIDGMPRWCNTCKIWKPDRSHHCSQIGRCVYKMDHFCPWAGGVVCETSFKFFIQFCCYAGIYCIFVLIVAAYSLSQLESKTSYYGRNIAATIALAAMFGLFSAALGLQSLAFAAKNTTTVDNLGHATKLYCFAVLTPSNIRQYKDHQTDAHGLQITDGQITYPLDAKLLGEGATSTPRTYRVWQTPLGYNPYDLGSALENIKTTMGNSIWEWVLPLRHSPSSSFLTQALDPEMASGLSMYKLRNAVEAIKQPTR